MGHGPGELAHALARMARDMRDADSVETTLEEITALAAAEIDGAEDAGVSLGRKGGGITSAAVTDPVVERIDRVQDETGQGPGVDAVWTRAVLSIEDMSRETRWRDFVAGVRGLGVRSMLSFRLFTLQDTLGALNLYARTPHAFTAASYETGTLFAAHAAVALAGAQREHNLESGLHSRQRIGEATGILMERFKITDRQAFAMLAQVSQDGNVKLRDLAEDVVRTGAAPEDSAAARRKGR